VIGLGVGLIRRRKEGSVRALGPPTRLYSSASVMVEKSVRWDARQVTPPRPPATAVRQPASLQPLALAFQNTQRPAGGQV
jgi:hypothetical protein